MLRARPAGREGQLKFLFVVTGDNSSGKRKLGDMAEKRTKREKALRQSDHLEKKAEARPEEIPKERRRGAIRSGEERRKIDVPPPAPR
jgi:hypothetical protein